MTAATTFSPWMLEVEENEKDDESDALQVHGDRSNCNLGGYKNTG